MKILFLALEPPYPANDGGRIRTFNMIKQIGRDNQITVVTIGNPCDYPGCIEELQPFCQEIYLTPPPVVQSRTWAKKFSDLRRRHPVSLEKYATQGVRERIRGLISQNKYDVVHLDQINLAQYLDELNSIPVVLTHHNIETLAQRRELWQRPDRFGPSWWLAWLEHYRWLRYEIDNSRRCDALVTVSELEAEYFRSHASGVPTFVVANGVDTGFFKPVHENRNPGAILYTGRMDYRPNIEAMLWFCREIFPLIQKDHPAATLTIVGRDPVPEIRALSHLPGVCVTGTVADVRPYFAEASIYIAPIRQGGGTRLKILEAMSMEMPVIATRIGSEGLELNWGEDILLADTAIEFASGIGSLIENSSRRLELGLRARSIVVQKYDWTSIAAEQKKAYEAAILRHKKQRAL